MENTFKFETTDHKLATIGHEGEKFQAYLTKQTHIFSFCDSYKVSFRGIDSEKIISMNIAADMLGKIPVKTGYKHGDIVQIKVSG